MKTKLENIAGYLAGRDDDSGPLRAELADPSSEASRFLEATRAKSRALLGDPPEASPAEGPRTVRRPYLAALAGLGCLAVAIALPLWIGEVRHRRLEATLRSERAESAGELGRLEARLAKALDALKPPPSPEVRPSREPAIEAGVERIEASLIEHGRRLDDLARSRPPPAAGAPIRPDPALAEIRAELVLIRREVAANEQGAGRQFQELRTIVQELNQILRRVLGRPQPGANNIEGPRPMMIPLPTPAFPDPRGGAN